MSMSATGPRPARLRETHLRDYWRVLWHGRWTVLAVFVIVVTAVGVWSFLQTPLYRATATVEVQPKARRLGAGADVSGLGAAGYGWFAEEKYQNTQVEIIRSRQTAKRVVEDLGLETDPMFKTAEDPVGVFRGMVQVQPRRETGLIEISMTGADRHKVAAWVNAVAHAYVNRNIEKARENVRLAKETIESEINPLQEGVREAESNRIRILKEADVLDPEQQRKVIQQQLSDYTTKLTSLESEISRLDSMLRQVREYRDSGADPMAIPVLANDEEIQQLNREKLKLETRLEEQKVNLGPRHPSYEASRKQLTNVSDRIAERASNVLANLQNEYRLAKREKDSLEEKITQARQRSFEIGKTTSNYEIYKTEAETRKKVYDVISNALQQVVLEQELLNMANNVAILDEATVPRAPVSPRPKLNLAVGVLMGLFLGVGGVFFLDYLDNSFREPDDIEKYLGLSVLATVPRMREKGIEAHAVKESYQNLRTSVIFSSKSGERKVMLITSTGPQEGKSATVANLGRTLARAGDRVIIVDCDLRRPTQHFHFDLDRGEGLTNYLAAPGPGDNWSQVVRRVGPGSLDLVSCGPIPPNPTELFGTERFSRLLERLREEYDWVLLDSPPAASLADSMVLASMTDMVILVVQHNRTDRDLAARVAQQLRNINPALVGAVLNNVDIQRGYQKEYYYAGYYYKQDDEATSTGRKRRQGSEKRDDRTSMGA